MHRFSQHGVDKARSVMKEMFVSALQVKVAIRSFLILQICSAMSSNDLITFWNQTTSKWPFSGHFEFCNIYLTQEMQNDWTMNIIQNVMSHKDNP